jgi:DNA polymerase-4
VTEYPAQVRVILHVDMDAFFASVEQRDDPRLRGRPVLVGGPSQRGVVAAASYEARRYGVRSAMPMVEARRRCPDGIVVAARHARYAEVSAEIFRIFGRFTPLVEGLSLDEAFLDVSASQSLFGDGETIARQIKKAIVEELRLTASAGVAPSKFVAKIASDLQKPDGLVVVKTGEERAFLEPLPVERMWGIGPKTAARVRSSGLRTLGDLAVAPPALLEKVLGKWACDVQRLARGEDNREVIPDRSAVSVGAEETFERDITNIDAIEAALLAQSGRVAQRLLRAGVLGTIVVVKIKYADFTLRTRRTTLAEPVGDAHSIYRAAKSLLSRFDRDKRIRLTGVSVSGLVDGRAPLTLFPDPSLNKRRQIEQLVADVRDRYGADSLTRATLLASPRSEPPRGVGHS